MWYKGNGEYYIYSMFSINGKLVLLCPLYSADIPDIKVNLPEIDRIIKGPEEAIMILIYDSDASVSITIEGETRYFNICNETKVKDKWLTAATLLYDDYHLLPLWYKYYKQLGVEHFYLYYNGSKLPADIFQADDITYIIWNIKYWTGDAVWRHHAQPLQMNHALWKYGCETEYMIFADLDEYMIITDALEPHDRIMFNSHWAMSTSTFRSLNRVYYDKTGIPERNKCIYRTSSVKHVPIHGEGLDCCNRMMLHFYNWSKPERIIKDVEWTPIDI
jgi:hypothetical protein